MRHMQNVTAMVTWLAVLPPISGFAASTATPMVAPRMYYADDVSGRPFSKDPAVVKFQGKYWLYYSVPPYEGKRSRGWTIGVATSDNLLDWSKAGELDNTGQAEAKGFTAPGAFVLGGKVHLFYQTYGNGKRDAICHAWSEDGLNFTRDPTNPIFRPTGQWTVGRAIDADVIPHGDKLLLYWATRDPNMKTQMLGVAAAPLGSDFSRENWIQLNRDGPILAPTVPTRLDAPQPGLGLGAALYRGRGDGATRRSALHVLRRRVQQRSTADWRGRQRRWRQLQAAFGQTARAQRPARQLELERVGPSLPFPGRRRPGLPLLPRQRYQRENLAPIGSADQVEEWSSYSSFGGITGALNAAPTQRCRSIRTSQRRGDRQIKVYPST